MLGIAHAETVAVIVPDYQIPETDLFTAVGLLSTTNPKMSRENDYPIA
jgi:hypothetical protein